MAIDIHAHIRKVEGDQDSVEEALLADMRRNGIERRVISAMGGWEAREGNLYVSELVSRYSDRLMGCAVVDPSYPGARERAEEALSLPGMGMLELNSFEHGYYPDSCEGVAEVLAVADCLRTPVKVFTGIGARSMPQQWMCHVRRHPNLAFVFLHMGCFDYGYGCIDLARSADNLFLETSNQYEMQILRKAAGLEGEGKVAFGSLWPERLTKCSLDVFDTVGVSEAFRHEVFEAVPARLIGLADAALRRRGVTA